MTLGRWFGPGLIDRHGRVARPHLRLARARGSRAGHLGLGAAVAMAGAALWGLGAALGFPVGMSAAGDDPSTPGPGERGRDDGLRRVPGGPAVDRLPRRAHRNAHALSVTGGLVAFGLLISGVLRPFGSPP